MAPVGFLRGLSTSRAASGRGAAMQPFSMAIYACQIRLTSRPTPASAKSPCRGAARRCAAALRALFRAWTDLNVRSVPIAARHKPIAAARGTNRQAAHTGYAASAWARASPHDCRIPGVACMPPCCDQKTIMCDWDLHSETSLLACNHKKTFKNNLRQIEQVWKRALVARSLSPGHRRK